MMSMTFSVCFLLSCSITCIAAVSTTVGVAEKAGNTTKTPPVVSSGIFFKASPGEVTTVLAEALAIRCSYNYIDLLESPEQVDRVVSIIISKATGTGRQTLASVTSFDPPVLYTKDDRLSVSGAITPCNNSFLLGEAFLEVTWAFPLRKQSGSYECEMSILSQSKHQSTHYSNLEVKVSAPTIEELAQGLIKVKMESARLQTQLADVASKQDRGQLRFETGKKEFKHTDWGPASTFQTVTYSKAFKNTPKTLVSVTSIDLDGSSNVRAKVSSQTTSGFDINISGARIDGGMEVTWMSIGE